MIRRAPVLHLGDRPSSTAQWTTLARALELDEPEPIVIDRFAPVFLSASTRLLYRGLGFAAPLRHRAERFEIAGLAASTLCRHRFIDDHLLAALPDVEQVLILGAGYDTRAYRFAAAIGERPVFEVDLAPLSRRKAGIIDRQRGRFGDVRVHRVEIDFRTQSLPEQLAGAGFRRGVPTFVAWEGVSMYLDRPAVDETLAAVAAVAGRGTVVAMDFWQQVSGAGGQLRVVAERAMRLIGEPITFPVPARVADAVPAAAGFTPIDRAEADELTARYATGGRRCDPGLYVLAARLA